MSQTPDLYQNAVAHSVAAKLSILIPFKGDDPTPLLAALGARPGPVELVILDDGSNDPALTNRVRAALDALAFPARLLTLATNEGRARGRNRLVSAARSDHFLFLDADMLPDDPGFLDRWIALVEHDNPPVAFGGFSVDQVEVTKAFALHRAMAGHSDCLPASDRQKAPEKTLFTSNLLVRRDVFEAEAFDEAFTGWGWEDVEWAMRVARRWSISHIDNTATHLGLDTASALAAKYEQSVGNFARVVVAHREVVSTYPSFRVARALRPLPLRAIWRPLLKACALSEQLPLKARALAMRFYRAALYAEVV